MVKPLISAFNTDSQNSPKLKFDEQYHIKVLLLLSFLVVFFFRLMFVYVPRLRFTEANEYERRLYPNVMLKMMTINNILEVKCVSVICKKSRSPD